MKKLSVMLGLVCILGLSAACKKSTQKPDVTATPVLKDQMVSLTPISTVQPLKTKELPIYTISADQTELSAVTVLLTEEKELNEQIVSEAVTEALADNAFYVKVKLVTLSGSRITIDFDSSAPPVTRVTRELEELILDAYAMSMIDNISECKEVGFAVDGGAYKSNYRSMSLDSVYLRR